MLQFSDWLSQTSFSLVLQNHLWMITVTQCIHILAISVVLGSVFMIGLRVLGLAGLDQTLVQNLHRFVPFLFGALCVSLATGIVMVISEPARDLMSFSFWAKMSLLATATVCILLVHVAAKRNERHWEEVVVNQWTTKSAAIVILLIFAGVTILGRLIAYDSIWGSWSRVPRG